MTEEDLLKEAVSHFEKELPPEILVIMEKAKRGEMSEEEIMESLAGWITKNSKEAHSLTSKAMEIFDAPDGNTLTLEDVWEDREQEGKNPRLNPMYEAALLERMQFDGDIPELRTGPISEGVKPAVPVETDVKNPVALGLMLETASDEVNDEIKALQGPWAESQQKKLEAATTGTDLIENPEKGLTPLDKVPQPKGYQQGEKAALRKVAKPSGTNLLGISHYKKQELAWKTFSTTHGRRSAAHVISFDIQKDLSDIVTLSVRDLTKKKALFEREWVSYLSEQGAINPEFSFIEIAAKSLATILRKDIEHLPSKTSLFLEVTTVNRISDRQVGWKARVLRG
jgi:hypothetical protein